MKNVIIRTAILCSVATHFLDKCFPQIYKPFGCVVGKEHSRRLKKEENLVQKFLLSIFSPIFFQAEKSKLRDTSSSCEKNCYCELMLFYKAYLISFFLSLF